MSYKKVHGTCSYCLKPTHEIYSSKDGSWEGDDHFLGIHRECDAQANREALRDKDFKPGITEESKPGLFARLFINLTGE